MRRPLRLFSIVYGERYIDWFERGCMRALLWPRNHAALKTAMCWDLWTMPECAERVEAIAARLGVPLRVNMMAPYDMVDGAARKEQLKAALIAEMDECKDRYAFLWIAPDSMLGEGSVPSIVELGSVPGICVAFAPMRVRSEMFIETLPNGPVSNAELVKHAFAHMHRTFQDAEATLLNTNSYTSGLSWRKIGEGLYAITYRKHSSYLLQPSRADYNWFRHMNKFGAYDHSFPKLLVDSQRQRVIGSSDAAFAAELTADDAHVPKVMTTNPLEPDYFNQDLVNHVVNRNTVCIWRAA